MSQSIARVSESIFVVLKNCVQSESLLAYAAGQLDALARVELETHLEQCEQCCMRLSQIVDKDETRVSVLDPSTHSVASVPKQLATGHPAFNYFSRNLSPTRTPSNPTMIGRYRIEKTLGSGGFGVVYLAADEKLGRKVAIKVPHSKLIALPEQLDLIQEEAKTVANLDHPHIVPIYDVGSCDEFPVYLVTKLIDGQDLAAKLHQGVTEADAVQWCLQIADALGYAHSKGIIHRDVKPQNILVDTQGEVWLTDFGLAWRTHDELTDNPRAGTPAYMSPEQLAGGEGIDLRSDVYALGRVLTELLLCASGSPQFLVPPADAVTQLRAAGQIELAEVCQQACAHEPEHRFKNTGELAETLFAYAVKRGWEMSSRLSNSLPRLITYPEQEKRQRRVWLRLGSLLAVLFLGVAIVFWQSTTSGRMEQRNIDAYLATPTQATYDSLNKLSARGIARLTRETQSADKRVQAAAQLALINMQPEFASKFIPSILNADVDLAELLVTNHREEEATIKQTAWEVLKNAQIPALFRLDLAEVLAKSYADDDSWRYRENCATVCQAWLDLDMQTRAAHRHEIPCLSSHLIRYLRERVQVSPARDSIETIHQLEAWAQLVDGDLTKQIECLVECSLGQANELTDKLKDKVNFIQALHAMTNSQGPDPQNPYALFHHRAMCVASYELHRLGEPSKFLEFAYHRDFPDLENSFANFCDESPDTLKLLASHLLDHDLLEPIWKSPHKAEELLFSPKLSLRRNIVSALFRTDKWTFLQREPFDAILAKLRTLVIEDADPGMQAVAYRTLKGIAPYEQWPDAPWFPRDGVLKANSDRSWSLNNVGMVLVHIEQAAGCDHNFCLGQCEVDSQTFEQFLHETGYSWSADKNETSDDGSAALRPRNLVSWYDCAAFCNWLSQREGLQTCYLPNASNEYGEGMMIKPNAVQLNGYRLPTSQEWEIGCLAGAKTPYSTGYHFRTSHGWTACPNSELKITGLALPNAFGLFDMHGNVSEWILNDPEQSKLDAPVNAQTIRLCRGGDYASEVPHASCEYRETHRISDRQASIGFRVARTLFP